MLQPNPFLLLIFVKIVALFFSYRGLQAHVESTAAVTLIMEQTH